MLVNDREELLDECLEGIDRIDAIVRDVRGFASGTTGPVESADLNTLIGDALRIVRARVGDDIRVEKQFDELIPVPCVPGEIVQVLVNLLVNAIHATGDTGRVQVSSWQHEHEIWICIEDNGYGVPRDVITRIFDPFFTTKVVGDGTGLGLAISHHIVRNHGGDLRVESEEGRGARFTLLLPVDPELPCTESAVSMLLSR
jgi:signal transduction histidine kinase